MPRQLCMIGENLAIAWGLTQFGFCWRSCDLEHSVAEATQIAGTPVGPINCAAVYVCGLKCDEIVANR